ncbi:MAG: hypothetical protein ACREQM_21725 [Candidatus Dormibacteraceae bacterium]
MSGERRREPPYGAPVAVRRWRKHVLSEMPWPGPCSTCGRPARTEVDGRRLCRTCKTKELGR